jgi:glutathione S-transferase
MRDRPLLVTIGVSHYCEKARWALDRAGVAYDEEAHAPVFHFAFTLPRTRTRTAPILVTKTEHLTESRDIVLFADRHLSEEHRLFPAEPALRARVEELAKRFDDDLGPSVRRLAYAHLVDAPASFDRFVVERVGRVESALARALGGGLRGMMRRAFRRGPGVADRMLERVQAVFARVERELSDGRPYLAGERFTAADLGFLALARPVLLLGYDLAGVPGAFAEQVLVARSTPVGAWALDLYAKERSRVIRGAG